MYPVVLASLENAVYFGRMSNLLTGVQAMKTSYHESAKVKPPMPFLCLKSFYPKVAQDWLLGGSVAGDTLIRESTDV